MKKFILMLAVVFTTASSFAANADVNAKVLQSFNEEFSTATDVQWTVGENFVKAQFVFNTQHVIAFYSMEGELMGVARYISSVTLPVALQNSLKQNYSGYWISDLFEVNRSSGTSYYVTLENADEKMMLQAESSADWDVYKRSRKI